MPRGILFLTAAFLLGMSATGFGKTGSTLKKIAAFDLPGPAGKRSTTLRLMRMTATLIEKSVPQNHAFSHAFRTS